MKTGNKLLSAALVLYTLGALCGGIHGYDRLRAFEPQLQELLRSLDRGTVHTLVCPAGTRIAAPSAAERSTLELLDLRRTTARISNDTLYIEGAGEAVVRLASLERILIDGRRYDT